MCGVFIYIFILIHTFVIDLMTAATVVVLFVVVFVFTVICVPSMLNELLSCPGTCSWPGESVEDMMVLVD